MYGCEFLFRKSSYTFRELINGFTYYLREPILYCTIANCGVDGRSAITKRVLNGSSADDHLFPWAVKLYRVDERGKLGLCTGSLISDRHVLTAAHCVYGLVKNVVGKCGLWHASCIGLQLAAKSIRDSSINGHPRNFTTGTIWPLSARTT